MEEGLRTGKCYIITPRLVSDRFAFMSSKPQNHAARLAAARNVRWTPLRAAAYDLLVEAAQPMTAYALLAALSDRQERDVKPASVYRALDALVKLGVVSRIESLNAFKACTVSCAGNDDEGVSGALHVFLVCGDCGDAETVHANTDTGLSLGVMQAAAGRGFTIERPVMEINGICKSCKDGVAA